jgi:hypothetical protein
MYTNIAQTEIWIIFTVLAVLILTIPAVAVLFLVSATDSEELVR